MVRPRGNFASHRTSSSAAAIPERLRRHYIRKASDKREVSKVQKETIDLAEWEGVEKKISVTKTPQDAEKTRVVGCTLGWGFLRLAFLLGSTPHQVAHIT